MQVLKVINNNVISCLDDRGVETVAMGRGLGFRAKPGTVLEPEAAEKIFRMDTPEDASRLENLAEALPPELLELCSLIVDYAGTILQRQLSKSIYLTLTDHLNFAITCCRQGMQMENPLETEVRAFYPEEYAVGRYALELISKHMQVSLPEDEAASVALHIINAEYGRTMNATMRAAQLLGPMVQILKETPGLTLNTGSLSYEELRIHLKFMVMEPLTRENPVWVGTDELLETRIPEAWSCARQICQYLRGETGNPVSDSELSYLAVCIHRACDRGPWENRNTKVL